MPALSVTVDDRHIATIRCDDFHVVAARVGGARVDEALATLAFTASTHPEVGESTYRIWISDLELRAGQTVTIGFLENGETTGAGQTIDDLYPDEPTDVSESPVQLAERFPQLRAKPNLRAGYTFEVATPSHPQFAGKTNPAEYSFGFHALWNWLQPNRLSVSLSTWTIDNVEFSTPSREHVREYIQPGQSATVRVNA